MGKRSDFERKGRDFYGTIDPAAITPAFASAIRGVHYYEPCVGDGDLLGLIGARALCIGGSDIAAKSPFVRKRVEDLSEADVYGADVIITNPPYDWKMLQPMLDILPELKPTWLLLPADFMHNIRSAPYMSKCRYVISIGRLYWEENKVKGKDNYCWYLFKDTLQSTRFINRGQNND